MLSAKAWKLDALIRLGLSVFVCVYGGSLLVTAMHHAGAAGVNLRFYSVLVAAFVFLGATLFLLRRPWRFEEALRRLVGLLACFYAGLSLGAWAQQMAGPSGPSMGQMVVGALSFQGLALVWISRFLREHQTGWVEAFGFANRWPVAVLLGIVMACFFLPVGWGLQWAAGQGLTHLPYWHPKPEEQQAVQTLRVATGWAHRLLLGALTILLAPVAEETLFRGILYTWVKQLGFPRLALWGTSLLFAAIHLNLVTFLPLLVLALLLAGLYEWTDNLLAPITTHALFNGLNFAALYLAQRQFS